MQKYFDFGIDKANLICYHDDAMRNGNHLRKERNTMENLQISLAAARVNAQFTQKEAAKMLKITPNTLVRWEKGETSPTKRQADEICKLYGLPISNIRF